LNKHVYRQISKRNKKENLQVCRKLCTFATNIRRNINMNNRLNNIAIKNDNESTLDFQQTWNLFLANWRWFLISVLAFVLFAGAYLWFIPQKVNVNSRMQVSDKSKQS
jgi:hypothetical protein